MNSRAFVSFVFLLALAGVAGADDYYLSTGDQDATVWVDQYQDSVWPWVEHVAVGDFNGDGASDVVFRAVNNVDSGVVVIFGRSFPKTSLFSEVVSFHVPLLAGMAGGGQPIALGDIDGDGKDELVVSDGPAGIIHVLTGTDTPFPTMDLTAAPIKIVGSPAVTGKTLVVGDFNGDGYDDIATGYQRGDARKAIGIVFGSSAPASLVTLATSPEVASVVLNTSAWDLKSLNQGRFSRANTNDVVAWVTTPTNDRVLILGTTTWDAAWDLAGTPPTAVASYARTDIVMGGDSVKLNVGDISGDGVADLFFNVIINDAPTRYNQEVVDGATLLSRGQWDLNNSAIPWRPPQWMAFGGLSHIESVSLHSLDFDGNGIQDLVALKYPSLSLDLFLDSDRPVLPPSAAFIYGDPFVRLYWTKALNTVVVSGDFNGDGIDDLLVHSDVEGRRNPTDAPFSMLSFFYGFRPLRNPVVLVHERSVVSSRVDLELSVEGDPVEMRLSGDIDHAQKDQWIPYVPSYAVTLTPSLGTRTVRATFRNQFHRESVPAEGIVARSISETQTRVVTNRISPGGRGIIDCHLNAVSTVRAQIVSITGDVIKTLKDEPVGPGIVPIEWDGTGPDGRRVVPGVYVVVIEIDGNRETHQVLLK